MIGKRFPTPGSEHHIILWPIVLKLHSTVGFLIVPNPEQTDPPLTLQDSLNFGHHGLNTSFTIWLMITVPGISVLCRTHLFWDWHALLQQRIDIIVKLLLEESVVKAGREGWVTRQREFWMLRLRRTDAMPLVNNWRRTNTKQNTAVYTIEVKMISSNLKHNHKIPLNLER